MSNKKDKQRYKNIQANKNKTCKNCSQLFWNSEGNPCCGHYLGNSSNHAIGILSLTMIKQSHSCFDEWNGKNNREQINLPQNYRWN